MSEPEDQTCAACGMLVGKPSSYHPHAACLMFQTSHDGRKVQANLRAVVEYAMMAQAAGVTLEEAMADITWQAAKASPSLREEASGDNYILDLRRNDGSVVSVLIPKEGLDNQASLVASFSNPEKPFGLNLVFGGHYL